MWVTFGWTAHTKSRLSWPTSTEDKWPHGVLLWQIGGWGVTRLLESGSGLPRLILTAACSHGVFILPVKGDNGTSWSRSYYCIWLCAFTPQNTKHKRHTVHSSRTLTSRRTAADYGTGARVRTLVPSRILPRSNQTAAVGRIWRLEEDDGW